MSLCYSSKFLKPFGNMISVEIQVEIWTGMWNFLGFYYFLVFFLNWFLLAFSRHTHNRRPQIPTVLFHRNRLRYQSIKLIKLINLFQSSKRGAGDNGYDPDDIENEPPLLEELGINFDHIRIKTMAVLNPLKETQADVGLLIDWLLNWYTQVIQDQDMAGPLVFCLLFGGALLLHGKVSFGYIYGIGRIFLKFLKM